MTPPLRERLTVVLGRYAARVLGSNKWDADRALRQAVDELQTIIDDEQETLRGELSSLREENETLREER